MLWYCFRCKQKNKSKINREIALLKRKKKEIEKKLNKPNIHQYWWFLLTNKRNEWRYNHIQYFMYELHMLIIFLFCSFRLFISLKSKWITITLLMASKRKLNLTHWKFGIARSQYTHISFFHSIFKWNSESVIDIIRWIENSVHLNTHIVYIFSYRVTQQQQSYS